MTSDTSPPPPCWHLIGRAPQSLTSRKRSSGRVRAPPASILRPKDAPKTPEEERRCTRRRVRVRCSFGAASAGGRLGLLCLGNRGILAAHRGHHHPHLHHLDYRGEAGPLQGQTQEKQIFFEKVKLKRLCVCVCARVFVWGHVLCVVQWSCG